MTQDGAPNKPTHSFKIGIGIGLCAAGQLSQYWFYGITSGVSFWLPPLFAGLLIITIARTKRSWWPIIWTVVLSAIGAFVISLGASMGWWGLSTNNASTGAAMLLVRPLKPGITRRIW